MSRQQALHILMMSPIYFRLPLTVRKDLLTEFCQELNQL